MLALLVLLLEHLDIINAGLGYTPASGNFQFNGVDLVTVTGNGRGAKADVYIQNGVAIAATVGTGGSGYQVGDVFTVSTIGLSSVGQNMKIVSCFYWKYSMNSFLIMFKVILLLDLQIRFSLSILLELLQNASTTLGGVQISSINVVNDGLHIEGQSQKPWYVF